MEHPNPYATPTSTVDTQESLATAEIESLRVSETWKERFRAIHAAGGSKLPNMKELPRKERGKAMRFNVIAFLFGPFYYVAKGMWRKAISLFVVCAAALIVLQLILAAVGFPGIGKALGYGMAAVFAARANIDYYKKMVERDNGWW